MEEEELGERIQRAELEGVETGMTDELEVDVPRKKSEPWFWIVLRAPGERFRDDMAGYLAAEMTGRERGYG